MNINILKDKGGVVTGAASASAKRIATAFIEGRARVAPDLNAKALNAVASELSEHATITIDGGSLTRGYPALLTGLTKAS